MLKLVKLIVFLLFYFTRAAVHVKRVEMMDKVNHTATSDVDKPADFSMQILTSQTQPEIEMVSVSYGLDRSISNSVERNSKASEMDLYQACCEGDTSVVRSLLELQSLREVNQLSDSGLSAMHCAARRNKKEVLQILIDNGADVNVIASMANKMLTPLHYAAWFNASGAVECLIENGADVESSSAFGQKPLHYVVSRASVELVEKMLTKGKANPNSLDNQKFTPLHLAAQRGRLDILEILLAHGADFRLQNDEDETAIHIAAKEGRNEILRHLLQRASMAGSSCKQLIHNENHEGKNCFQLAVVGGHVEAAMICVEYGADFRRVRSDSLPLHIASSLGDSKMVKFLLSHDYINVHEEDSEGMTPMLRASLAGNVEIIDHLIKKGASILPLPGSTSPSPLMCAVKRGQTNAIMYLLQHGAQIHYRDSFDRTCLHVAADSGIVHTVDLILQIDGMDLINSVDKDRRTPLHYAASKGNPQIVKKLLCAGADVNVQDEEEKLPFHLATESGNLECVKLLLEANRESLHSLEYRLRTPIYYAVFEGHVEIVRFLLDQGATVNQRDENHLTPLMIAARVNRYHVLVTLLDYGAKLGALSKNRSTALDVAAHFGNSRIVRELLDRGASATNKSSFGFGCLEAAISGSKEDTCLEIIKHKRWHEAVKVRSSDGFCLMKKLLEKFPEVAKVVMDKCIQTSEQSRTDPNYSKTYSLELLDPVPDEQTNSEGKRYFGPKVMLIQGHKELILHPLTRQLMRVKSDALTMKYIIAGFLFQLFFTINLVVILLCLNAKAIGAQHNTTSFFAKEWCTHELEPSKTISMVISGIALLSHIYRIYVEKWNYWLDISNILEIGMFVTALIAVSVDSERSKLSFTVLAILLAFLTLLSYQQSMFKAGIYVTMLFEVLRTLIMVIAEFFLLCFGFALVFYTLLSREANASRAGKKFKQGEEEEDDPFGRIDLSLLKVLNMMIGELEYNTFFVDKSLFIPDITRFIFTIFCILMPIVFMNLLIGLAVGDIESIQKNAELRLLAVQIEDVFRFEQRLPKFILRRLHKTSITKYPNKHCTYGWKRGLVRFQKIISGLKDNASLDEASDDIFEQTADSFFHRLNTLEQKVDKLGANIASQTEMLERVINMLPAGKEAESCDAAHDSLEAKL
ncbi:transient receptor potential cation channel subfamily A member 1-like isoform X2 [Acropora muricata]|uniref:transient receptor potential cation channel subfamily A member 1-like isoform X2 n=1 Tax=Acropora muricata TaxID=159855 RepID=UPI0034E4910F